MLSLSTMTGLTLLRQVQGCFRLFLSFMTYVQASDLSQYVCDSSSIDANPREHSNRFMTVSLDDPYLTRRGGCCAGANVRRHGEKRRIRCEKCCRQVELRLTSRTSVTVDHRSVDDEVVLEPHNAVG